MSDAATYTEDLYFYAERAYNSDDYKKAKNYTDKAIRSATDVFNSAKDAKGYASDCGCDDGEYWASSVESYANDALRYALSAYKSDNLKDVQYYANKTISSADDAMSNASFSEDECD